MFHTLISDLTDAEIAADIATCEAVLRTGEVNGFYLDSDCEADYRGWLEDLCEERNTRSNAADYAPTGGLNEALFVAAFGRTPEEEFA